MMDETPRCADGTNRGTKYVIDFHWRGPQPPDCPFPVEGQFVQLAWTAEPGALVTVRVGTRELPQSQALRVASTAARGFIADGRETTSVQTAATWFFEGITRHGPKGARLPCGTVFALS